MDDPEELVKAIAVTAEATDTPLSAPLLRMMLDELARYPEQAVAVALRRCARELKGRLRLPDIIDRIPCGWPTAEEAWARAVDAADEDNTVVWCEEMAAAFWIARPLLQEGDRYGARQAFAKAYDRSVGVAAAEGRRPKWALSLGRDVAMRRLVADEAIRGGFIDAASVAGILPPPADIPAAALPPPQGGMRRIAHLLPKRRAQ